MHLTQKRKSEGPYDAIACFCGSYCLHRENLELSDDEDTHPGAQFIEESTLRRMKRMTHERNESERAQKEQEARDRLAEGAILRLLLCVAPLFDHNTSCGH